MLKSVLALGVVFAMAPDRAIAGEYWDEQFGVPGASPGGISAATVLGNNVIVGGNFASIGGVAATNLAQWDGANWAPLGGGVQGGFVNALTVVGAKLFV